MKNFSGVCQAAGADKPLRAFFIWITNIVTLTVMPGQDRASDNLSGGVYEAHGEDFSFESLRLPVHSAGRVHHGCLGQGLRCFWARWSALLGKV